MSAVTQQLDPEFAAPTQPIQGALSRAAVVATVLGNGLEFYDFMCYVTFAVSIGRTFFPLHDPLFSLLLSLATFGVGFVTRPLGAVLIGAYGDRAGRRAALTLNIALMATGTLAIAVTPGYATIGVAAPIILVVARLIQGLSLGGEVGPSTALLLESAPAGRRARLTSWQGVSQGLSTLTAGLLALVLSAVLEPAQLDQWGWRVPFALGLLIVPVGVIIRRTLPEIPAGQHAVATGAILRSIWADHRRPMLMGVLALMSAIVATYIGLYMSTYALTVLALPPATAAWGTIATSAGLAAGSLSGGLLADRHGLRRVMMVPRALAIVLIVPCFQLLLWLPGVWTLLLVAFALALFGAVSAAALITVVTAAFPRAVRSSGLAITYALAVTLFGSTTQFVIAWLAGVTGNPLAPAYYGIATGLISLWAMNGLPLREPD